jgi:hypothetical protein
MNDNNMERFATMRDIGKMYSVSSHVIGRWLTRCGLREGGQPTRKAIDGGFSKEILDQDRGIWFFVWNVARTTAALEALIQECMGVKDAATGTSSDPTTKKLPND